MNLYLQEARNDDSIRATAGTTTVTPGYPESQRHQGLLQLRRGDLPGADHPAQPALLPRLRCKGGTSMIQLVIVYSLAVIGLVVAVGIITIAICSLWCDIRLIITNKKEQGDE